MGTSLWTWAMWLSFVCWTFLLSEPHCPLSFSFQCVEVLAELACEWAAQGYFQRNDQTTSLFKPISVINIVTWWGRQLGDIQSYF